MYSNEKWEDECTEMHPNNLWKSIIYFYLIVTTDVVNVSICALKSMGIFLSRYLNYANVNSEKNK